MRLRLSAPWLISTAVFITAGFLLPLPDFKLPDIPPRPDDKITSTSTPPSPIQPQFTPEDLIRLFEVRPLPAVVKEQKPPAEEPHNAPSPEPASPPPALPLPPLPPLRYVGEAVIQSRPVYYLMAGLPERLVRLTEESKGEYRLISTTEDELILEYRGAKYRLRRP